MKSDSRVGPSQVVVGTIGVDLSGGDVRSAIVDAARAPWLEVVIASSDGMIAVHERLRGATRVLQRDRKFGPTLTGAHGARMF